MRGGNVSVGVCVAVSQKNLCLCPSGHKHGVSEYISSIFHDLKHHLHAYETLEKRALCLKCMCGQGRVDVV